MPKKNIMKKRGEMNSIFFCSETVELVDTLLKGKNGVQLINKPVMETPLNHINFHTKYIKKIVIRDEFVYTF